MINPTKFNIVITVVVLFGFYGLFIFFERKYNMKYNKQVRKSDLFFKKIDKIKKAYEKTLPYEEFKIKDISVLPYSKKIIKATLKIFAIRYVVYNNDDLFISIRKLFFSLNSFQQINKNKTTFDIEHHIYNFENIDIKKEREKVKNEFDDFIIDFYDEYFKLRKRYKYQQRRNLYLYLKENYSDIVTMIEKENISFN